MNWLNIHIPSVIRSPEFVGSSPAERGTWLCVCAYACELECGGRIAGAAVWKDRQWQQACGVTLKEIRGASKLLHFDGSDLIVNAYPAQKQKQVAQARGVAMAGAMARWGKDDAGRHAGNMPTGIETAMPTGNAEGEGEGEGEGERKDKGKEKKKVGPIACASASGDDADDATWLASLSASQAYAGIDVARERDKCAVWCHTNRKQLTRRRLINWLNRCERPMQGPGRVANGGFAGEVASVRPKGWGTELPLTPAADDGRVA